MGGVGVLILLLAAIRAESLWIDELSSAYVASHSAWTDMIGSLVGLGSEAQMPFHVAWLWGWVRLFGMQEWTLRLSNLPWAMLAVIVWVDMARNLQRRIMVMCLLLMPLVCYYMNEARPYMMTFSTALLALWGAERRCAKAAESSGLLASVAFVSGAGLCLGASMLNVVLVPSLAIYMVVRCYDGDWGVALRMVLRRNAGLVVAIALMTVAFLGYYAWTLHAGYGGQRVGFSLSNLAFVVYEMMGFGGLGASRILLRELSVPQILSQYGVWLLLGVVAWLAALFALWQGRKRWFAHPTCRAAIFSLVFGMAGMVLAATIAHAALWGRHFMVLMPFFCLGIGVMLDQSMQSGNYVGRLAGWILIAVLMLSSARQGFLEAYRKDPIRESLAVLASLEHDQPSVPAIVLAYPLSLWYYPHPGVSLIPVVGWSSATVRRWQEEHGDYLILVHRADKFDPAGIWSEELVPPHAQVVWHAGNIRICRVTRDLPGKTPR